MVSDVQTHQDGPLTHTPAWRVVIHHCVCMHVRLCTCNLCMCEGWTLTPAWLLWQFESWTYFPLGTSWCHLQLERTHDHSRVKWKKENNLCVILANIVINILEIWKHKTSDSTSTSHPPLHKWREGDTQKETAEERDGETKSQIYRPPCHTNIKASVPTRAEKK